MLREVALRRALEAGRDRRRRDLDQVTEEAAGKRARLRELTATIAAVEAVRARMAPLSEAAAAAPAPAEAPVPEPEAAVEPPKPTIIFTPIAKEEEVHAELLKALARTHPDGFTVGEMRERMLLDGGKITYDGAWVLANNLTRKGVLALAGTRPGPAGPIRVFRVSDGVEQVV